MTSAGIGGHNVGGAKRAKERPMVIVAGYLVVEPRQRDSYLAGCKAVVRRARRTGGCLDFAISADLLDPVALTSSSAGSRRPLSMRSAVADPATNNKPRSYPRRFPNTTWEMSGG
jgi:hypothetical protein